MQLVLLIVISCMFFWAQTMTKYWASWTKKIAFSFNNIYRLIRLFLYCTLLYLGKIYSQFCKNKPPPLPLGSDHPDCKIAYYKREFCIEWIDIMNFGINIFAYILPNINELFDVQHAKTYNRLCQYSLPVHMYIVHCTYV